MAIENRLQSVEDSHVLLSETVTGIKEDTQLILATVKGASAIGTFVKKHGPRALAFAMGVLATSGVVSPEIARQVLHLFGV